MLQHKLETLQNKLLITDEKNSKQKKQKTELFAHKITS
jgi:hypothetical protein